MIGLVPRTFRAGELRSAAPGSAGVGGLTRRTLLGSVAAMLPQPRPLQDRPDRASTSLPSRPLGPLIAPGQQIRTWQFAGKPPMGDPGLEPGTSSLSGWVRGDEESTAVVKGAANWPVLGDASRPETTAVADLMHPICTPGRPPASAARSPAAWDVSRTSARLLRLSPTVRLPRRPCTNRRARHRAPLNRRDDLALPAQVDDQLIEEIRRLWPGRDDADAPSPE
jgi:hypothetical protein